MHFKTKIFQTICHLWRHGLLYPREMTQEISLNFSLQLCWCDDLKVVVCRYALISSFTIYSTLRRWNKHLPPTGGAVTPAQPNSLWPTAGTAHFNNLWKKSVLCQLSNSLWLFTLFYLSTTSNFSRKCLSCVTGQQHMKDTWTHHLQVVPFYSGVQSFDKNTWSGVFFNKRL